MRFQIIEIIALLVVALTPLQLCFTDVFMFINSSPKDVRVALDISIQFEIDQNIHAKEIIVISLPLFTRRDVFNINNIFKSQEEIANPTQMYDHMDGIDTDISSSNYDLNYGSLSISPSNVFEGAWFEGSQSSTTSFNDTSFRFSEIHLRINPNLAKDLVLRSVVTLNISKLNKIKVYCGIPSFDIYNGSSSLFQPVMLRYPFELYSANFSTNRTLFTYFDGVGDGCAQWNNCNNNGACDYCTQTCHCLPGYGAKGDIITGGASVKPDCSERKSEFYLQIFYNTFL